VRPSRSASVMKRVLPLTVGAVMPVGPRRPWGGLSTLRPRHTRLPRQARPSTLRLTQARLSGRPASFGAPQPLAVERRDTAAANARSGKLRTKSGPAAQHPLWLNVEVASLPEATIRPRLLRYRWPSPTLRRYKLRPRLHFVEKVSRTNRKLRRGKLG
jgi:hypothetical protein